MDKSIVRQDRRSRIHLRVRKKVLGTLERPRLTVFRSTKHFYAQAIDDLKGETIASASTLEKAFREAVPAMEKELRAKEAGPAPEGEKKKKSQPKKTAIGRGVLTAAFLGKYMAGKVKAKGITQVVFDRGGFLYHGQVKAFADGAREAGLSF